jgi:hypothetical protein
MWGTDVEKEDLSERLPKGSGRVFLLFLVVKLVGVILVLTYL